MRTTGIQVSGYGFLLRRLELALVIGDPRMAHDPLRSQRRAVLVGVLVSLLIAGGAVMMGLLRPAPNIGDARLVTDEQGSLHVRLDDGFHPVTNVASARLVLGQPVEASDATSAELAEYPLGSPMGIPLVPGLIEAPKRELVFCEPGVIVAAESVRWFDRAILRAPSGTWLINGPDRFLIDANAPRALGAVPVGVSDRMVEQFHRGPDVVMPQGQTGLPAPFDLAGRVLTAGDRAFIAAQGGVAELRGPRRAVAEALSPHAPVEVSLSEAMAQPEAAVLDAVPDAASVADVQWAQPDTICMGDAGLGLPQLPPGQSLPHGVGQPVDPNGPGYAGPGYVGPRGTLPVTTERGMAVVGESGIRFGVGSEKDLRALGFSGAHLAPWRVIQWLPDGGLLSAESARTTSAAMRTANNNGASSAGTL